MTGGFPRIYHLPFSPGATDNDKITPKNY